MTNRDSYTTVADGDVLQDGFFNEIITLNRFSGILGTTSPRNSSVYNHVFTSDDAATKTNFTHNANFADYTVLGTDAGVLETADVLVGGTILNNMDLNISKAFSKFGYYIFTVYDECNDSSIDTDLWDTDGSPTEDTESITLTLGEGTAYFRTDATNGNFFGSDDTFAIGFSGGSGAGYCYLDITDGSTTVNLFASAVNETVSARTDIIKFDSANTSVHALIAGVYTEHDLSSLSGSWLIQFRAAFDAAATTVRCHFLRKITGSETTTVSSYFSSDAGDNYDAVSNGYANITNKGFVMKAKFESTPVAGEGVNVSRIDFQGFTDSD